MLVHGDDYASVGDLDGLRWLQEQLEADFEMKTVVVGHSWNELSPKRRSLTKSSVQRMRGGSLNQTRDLWKSCLKRWLCQLPPRLEPLAPTKPDNSKTESNDNEVSPELGAQAAS